MLVVIHYYDRTIFLLNIEQVLLLIELQELVILEKLIQQRAFHI